MKKLILFFCALWFVTVGRGQSNESISTMDFIEVIDGHTEEALFYYQNNWKTMREKAQALGYIKSFSFLETENQNDAPFQFILVTTYANRSQFEKKEEHFRKIMDSLDGPRFLNSLRPKDFRKNYLDTTVLQRDATRP